MQEQQQILEMKQQVSFIVNASHSFWISIVQETERVQAKEEELAHTQQQLNEKVTLATSLVTIHLLCKYIYIIIIIYIMFSECRKIN